MENRSDVTSIPEFLKQRQDHGAPLSPEQRTVLDQLNVARTFIEKYHLGVCRITHVNKGGKPWKLHFEFYNAENGVYKTFEPHNRLAVVADRSSVPRENYAVHSNDLAMIKLGYQIEYARQVDEYTDWEKDENTWIKNIPAFVDLRVKTLPDASPYLGEVFPIHFERQFVNKQVKQVSAPREALIRAENLPGAS
ncbi:hypothetical protein BBO99_00007675 [Phytophthora kernoviae]|uniref:Uncharacterized protein n=2 Tax=Phytophthora kernoviae TaxID=325452 RepID=A0A3R7G5P9_9STRA|nr:hypothetical protein G195_008771 [Phytophthora kernoviae 00238/432]KAG2520111.1 hypothetical protein JM18_007272 [Phytophthora kernoviae]KAG2523838.1 hypothetical protein JM16_002284 [Phytophthora kernoviae]RLN37418.1 hypothetical protein BBI17_007621 [Phytophthora kernoviae]RLN76288.1 hypothetical protein BBO99_00007675 [Phytophthora kernoviae]